MKRRNRKTMSLKWMIIIFIISTLTLSVGYSLLYETLSIESTANIIIEQKDEDISTNELKFTYNTTPWYNGKYYYQIDGILKNISLTEINDWKVILYFSEEPKLINKWNGNYSLEGNKLIITPVKYNSIIGKNSNVSLGFQLSSQNENLKIEKIVLNGEIVSDIQTDAKLETDSNLTIISNFINEWPSNNKYISQYKFIIKNNSDVENNNWQIKIKIPSNTEVKEAWGCNYINEDGILKLSSVNYNTTIPAGNSIEFTIQFISEKMRFVPTIINE